ncbi:hypothetical protein [Amycolatopsis sp. EV170708-02-1]|uniref:hypothetical protein n=1 Tax=Amycolatopsis sp. EV170708-02-1 TaxID=2919322 RepID=UPI001F0C67CA|nr:hypothetical protein [Amycolatopsis sp. EV170708-02-1]UMO99610.1 hypothetical protein MJQ72_24045 [Amycolatopsis sp. EV170708-02-1]
MSKDEYGAGALAATSDIDRDTAASLDSAASQALKSKGSSKKSEQRATIPKPGNASAGARPRRQSSGNLAADRISFGEVLRHPRVDLDRMLTSPSHG